MAANFAARIIAQLIFSIAFLASAAAADRPFDRDWRTGVPVAPGAETWTDKNLTAKQALMAQVAETQSGRICTHYAFLHWPANAEASEAIQAQTKRNYEAAGYTITAGTGDIPADKTLWIAHKADREAVILWGAEAGSPAYMSCLTQGAPAADPDRWVFLIGLFGFGLAGAVIGGWLVQRTRALGKASLTWPSAQGRVTSAVVDSYRTKGGRQYIANIAYSYDVDGKAFAGNRVRFGNYAGAKEKADADVARFASGTPVDVFYNPLKPEAATLEPGTSGHSVAGLVVAITGAILVVVGLIVAFIS
ncbi:DUF3592 domain-containing protein [Hyphomicrobium sulfonivorans]|uniref:DUF3592 domain-containing protein n=1 Tax=Hyphomicrobium sulfonivorans TaxID=121290 RepID=UPI00156F122C|nr:DUF3592 domain-containing protein [Hyphomicrobium sulfonivorans]MBI1650442.1 DUF3592 domain-containing protein [Hyphomicrobium sulfonivorans]NSL72198.1 hypothetical protein [Hyphomicrobium sulfonivorans]